MYNVLVVCRCFQQWSVEHSHTHRSCSGWPCSAHDIKINALCEQQWLNPREEIRVHVTPAVSLRTIGNLLLAAGLRSHVPLAGLPLTPRHCQAQLLWYRERVDWRLEWCSLVFNDESRFCLYANDGHTYVWHRPGEHHLPQCIRPRLTGPTSGFMVWGAINYNSWSHLVFLQGKINSACYIAQIVNPVLLPFL